MLGNIGRAGAINVGKDQTVGNRIGLQRSATKIGYA